MNKRLSDTFGDARNACGPASIHTVRSDIPMDRILEVSSRNGYDPKRGMNQLSLARALDELGVSHSKMSYDYGTWKRNEYGDLDKLVRSTLAEFCRTHPRGAYIVGTTSHWQAVVDGIVIDPYVNSKPLMGGRIDCFVEIHDPVPMVRNSGVEISGSKKIRLIVDKNPKRAGTASRIRYERMRLIACLSPTTVDEVFSRTDYTIADLRNDLAKGYLTME